MESFSYSIKMALLLFPVVALFFTLPYILWQYHKYGSVNSFRSIIVYSLLLYLMSAYFLVILPLPSIETVSKMTKPAYNLQPFHLISEILNKTSFHVSDFATYFPTLKNPVVYEALFNILLTLPFGVYLHYYFQCDFKHTLLYSFCFSLFFELTQLSGLYFIYPRSYRVFDVDDLILNTTGGVFGYFVGSLFLKFLPTRDEIDKKSIAKGTKVSVFRRFFCFFLDLIIFGTLTISILYLLKENKFLNKGVFFLLYFVCSIFYYVFIPSILHGKTLGMKFLKLKFVTSKEKIKWYYYFCYYFWLMMEYIFLPIIFLFVGYFLFQKQTFSQELYEYYFIIILAISFMGYVISFLKRLFKIDLIYEKIAHLKIISTIQN